MGANLPLSKIAYFVLPDSKPRVLRVRTVKKVFKIDESRQSLGVDDFRPCSPIKPFILGLMFCPGWCLGHHGASHGIKWVAL